MLSVATVTEPMGRTYYANASENYYTRDASALDRWQGNLCREGGLQEGSTIQADQFQLMLANSGSEKCSAYDCTFSAPKSVSILAELGTEAQHKELLAAHQAAVEATLHEIEDKEIGARITHNGVTEHVHTGRMIAAKFEHDISREMDPQMHTHCVIMNRTEYQGKSYAVDGSPLYKIQKVYGMEYRARLAAELQARGYAIHVTDHEHGFSSSMELNRKHFSISRNAGSRLSKRCANKVYQMRKQLSGRHLRHARLRSTRISKNCVRSGDGTWFSYRSCRENRDKVLSGG